MPKRSSIVFLAAAIAAYFGLWWLVPRAAFLPLIIRSIESAAPLARGQTPAYLSFLAAVVVSAPVAAFMAVQIAIVYYFASIKMDFRHVLAGLFACLAGIALLLAAVIWQSGFAAQIGRYPNLREHFYILAHYFGALKPLITLLIMLFAACVGYGVSLLVRDKNLLLPVVMFAAYIDFWTVTRGPVSAVLKRAPEVVHAVAAPIPQAGAGAFVPSTYIGPGDFLFLAVVFAVVHKLDMKAARNYWFVFAAMTIGMLAVMAGIISSLPALMVLAVAVVAANWRQFRLSRQEAVSIAVVGVLLLISLPVVWSLLGPAEQSPPPKPKPPAQGSQQTTH